MLIIYQKLYLPLAFYELIMLKLIQTGLIGAIKHVLMTMLQHVNPEVEKLESTMVVLLTCGVSCHLDDALAVHPSFPGVEGSDPHRHLD